MDPDTRHEWAGEDGSALTARDEGAEDLGDASRLTWSGIAAVAGADGQMPGQIGRFHVVRELGRGGFGIVYLAFDPKLGRQVALKLPRVEMLHATNLRHRFLREAQTTALLDHANIAPLFETGEIGSVCYLVSPYCSGGTLADRLAKRDQPLPVRQGAALVLRLAEAVHYAHTRGVLHRDIKPANVLLEPATLAEPRLFDALDFVPRLSDFGLARFVEEEGGVSSGGDGTRTDAAAPATVTGAMLGTPRYMAPEQVEGCASAIGPATDVYGLGALLYETLTGEPVFGGGSKADALRRVLTEEPRAPRRIRGEIPADLEAICIRCLEKQPAHRYGSAAELAADLQRLLRGEPTHARPLTAVHHTVRWIRREKALAALLATLAVAILALILGLSIHNSQLETAAADVRASHAREHAQLRVAQQRELSARQHAYLSDIRRASRMWNEGEGYRISDLLQRWNPREGQRDVREFAWRYLWSLGGNLSDLTGHTGGVHGLCFSPGGELCASWSGDVTDRSIRLWRVRERAPQLRVRTDGLPRAVEFTAYGSEFISVDDRGNVCRWDARTGLKKWSIFEPDLQLQSDRPNPAVAFSQDGALLAYESFLSVDGNDVSVAIRLWNMNSGNRRTLGAPIDHDVFKLEFSEDATQLAVAGPAPPGQSIRILEITTGDVQDRFRVDQHLITDLRFSIDHQRLVAGLNSGEIRQWNLTTGQLETVGHSESHVYMSLALSPDGQLIACGRDDVPARSPAETVRIREMRSGDVVAEPGTAGEPIQSLGFSPDSQLLAYGGGNGLLRMWNRRPRQAFKILTGHTGEAWSVAFVPASSLLISTSDDHTAKLWDMRSNQLIATLEGHPSLVTCVAIAPDGRTAVTSDFGGRIMTWDIPSGSPQFTLDAHSGTIRGLAHHPNAAVVASVADDQTIKLWDTASGRLRASIDGHEDKIRAVLFDPSGELLITAGNDGFVKLWDPERGQLVRSWQHASEVHSLAITTDGALLAAGSAEGTIRLYRMPAGQLAAVLPGPPHGARSLAFSPGAHTLASGGKDAAVTLWQIATGQELLTLPGVASQVNGLAFAPDGRSLVAATHDGSVICWRISPEP